jgi:hypothetical protein
MLRYRQRTVTRDRKKGEGGVELLACRRSDLRLRRELGAALGVDDMARIRRRLGSKRAYRLREAITLGIEQDWRFLLRVPGSHLP